MSLVTESFVSQQFLVCSFQKSMLRILLDGENDSVSEIYSITDLPLYDISIDD